MATEKLVVVPAYGRTYASAAEVKADWEADKDFTIMDSGGVKVNRQDVKGRAVAVFYRDFAGLVPLQAAEKV